MGHRYLRWQAHLPVSLVMAVNALIAFLAGYATMAAAFNIVTLLCLGFVLIGITRGIRREIRGTPDELFQSTISRVGPAAADASE
ncbi:hypothetical protein [Pseudarthrobacter sp. PH31-O2]|uniref:hypothetical protein n=1 Tax=Pseudarthrobacter sp. PH31-O2 TaxID=3046206 RepID=UPI0024BBAFBF|nr:hypothetical protein [Pseudarthrobacter sp. PH31-O2]MDJ0354463.1 hypothetical protein [Pseudarthrobacter sp. PH31-O2]